MRAIVAFSFATEKPFPEVQHELPLPDKQRGDLYLRRKDDTGPRVILEFKYIAVDHFIVKDGIYKTTLADSVKDDESRTLSIIGWTPEQKKEARGALAALGGNFDGVKINYRPRQGGLGGRCARGREGCRTQGSRGHAPGSRELRDDQEGAQKGKGAEEERHVRENEEREKE